MRKIYSIVVSMVMMVLFSANAYAQQDTIVVDRTTFAQQDTTVVDRTTLQAIVAHDCHDGCCEVKIIGGVPTISECYGWQVSAGTKVAVVHWNSELGSKNSVCLAPIITGAYRLGHWQPEVSYALLIGAEVENQKLNSSELTLSVRYNFNKHDHKGGLRAYVAPSVTYRDMKSVDFIDLGPEWETFKNPFHGHYVAFGGKFGFDVNIGKIIKHSYTTVGNNKFLRDIVGHSVLSFEGGVDYGQINKLRDGITNTSLKLVTYYFKVAYTIDLP